MEFFRDLIAGLVQAWKGISPSARINLVVAGLATVAVIVTFVILGAQTQYVSLFPGDLEPGDIQSIISYLEEESEDYKTGNKGKSILVPSSRRREVRTALFLQDLPKTLVIGAGVGYEILDRTDFRTNKWLQDVNLRRAVQSECQRMINDFEFVNSSRVEIREAKTELFSSTQQPSEAAVMLDVSRTPSKVEVAAIAGIVSSYGGPNLDKNHIIITTTDGVMLKKPSDDDFSSLANDQLGHKSEVERQREEKIRQHFSELGLRAIVAVSAEIDYDDVKEIDTTVSEGQPVSDLSSTTSITSTSGPPVGPPGVGANIPGAPPGMGSTGGVETTEELEETITNYQPSTKTTTRESNGFKVTKWLADVIVEGKSTPVLDADGNPTGEMTYVGLEPQVKDMYTNHILAAVGPPIKLEDVTLSDSPFEIDRLADIQAQMREAAAARRWSMAAQIGRPLMQLVAIGVALLFIRGILRRAIQPPEIEEEVPEKELEVPEPTQEDIRRQKISDEIERMAADNPEVLAALLRSWLHEEEDM